MRYNHAVKYNGRFYAPGEEIPRRGEGEKNEIPPSQSLRDSSPHRGEPGVKPTTLPHRGEPNEKVVKKPKTAKKAVAKDDTGTNAVKGQDASRDR